MAEFDELLRQWQAADRAACEAEAAACLAQDLHLRGLADAPPAVLVAAARLQRVRAQHALAAVYAVLRDIRSALPLI